MSEQQTILSPVFITEELAKRPPRPRDYLAEKAAIQALAVCMAEHPDQVLPKFVELAMQLAGGVSAGLSLYEPDPAPGVFRWTYLRGAFSRFEGAVTPRNFSPCGVTLDMNAPVLSSHPERAYAWIADQNLVVPEVLLVPLYINRAEPLGTLWIVSDEENHFNSDHARVARDLADFVGVALRMVRAEQRLEQALDEQETLTREMRHRVLNLFAITEGLVRLSAKSASTKEELAGALVGRLHALANVQTLLRRSPLEPQEGRAGSPLATLLEAIVKPHDHTSPAAKSRFEMAGSAVACGENAASGIALVFHELITNATKYGALSGDEGHVSIRWRRRGGQLIIRWAEKGGPLILSTPTHEGFGSTLVRATIVKQFGGSIEHRWRRSGLSIVLTIELARLLN